MTVEISPADLKAEILSRSELAIIDVREQGVSFDSHLLWASNIPLSRLECDITQLVPRKSAPIVVCDSGPKGMESTAHKARERLAQLGFSNVRVLSGGTAGWADEGYELFSGLNVPSKTFGEYLLQQRKPPEILAAQLDQRIRENDNLVVLDSRPMDEFSAMSIPTAIDVPGAELVLRSFDVAPDASTLVVVNCAGRTRSIVGAMSLINAGIPNPVMLLKDGTMGWQLAGLSLEHGQSVKAPTPSEKGLADARNAAQRVARKYNVESVSRSKLEYYRNDPERTLYLFDVRTEEEYLEKRVSGSQHAPGGQLVQTTDEFIAVRNSRIVLIDEHRVRAIMTASWLKQMGEREVYVLEDPFAGDDIETSAPAEPEIAGFSAQPTIAPGELHAVIQSGEPMMLVDLSCSRNYRVGHIPQAHWCVRQRLDSSLTFYRPIGLLVLTSEDATIAHLAANDIAASDPRQLVRVLDGGNDHWARCGYMLAAGMDNALCSVDDVWDRPYDRDDGQEQKMKEYLTWEVQLMDQALRDGTTFFHC